MSYLPVGTDASFNGGNAPSLAELQAQVRILTSQIRDTIRTRDAAKKKYETLLAANGYKGDWNPWKKAWDAAVARLKALYAKLAPAQRALQAAQKAAGGPPAGFTLGMAAGGQSTVAPPVAPPVDPLSQVIPSPSPPREQPSRELQPAEAHDELPSGDKGTVIVPPAAAAPSKMPLILGVGAAGVAAWWFFFRKKNQKKVA